jgi:hypothetical protein
MKYSLVGVDGNAFSIMGYVAKAMRREGKSKEEIDKYYELAESSDYHNLLTVSADKIHQLNKSLEDN